MEIKYVNFKAPVKKFKKEKETGDVHVISRITFECEGMDDETLMLLTHLSDSGTPVSVDIKSAMFRDS